MPKISADKEKIIAAMLEHSKGGFNKLDPEEFTDKRLAEAFNSMLDGMSMQNNEFLMRINESMADIGNNTWLKSMFEAIAAQQESLKMIQQNRDLYKKSFQDMDKGSINAINSIKQLEQNFMPWVDGGTEIVEELYRCVECGEMQLEAAERIKRILEFNNRAVIAMQDDIEQAVSSVETISRGVSEQIHFVRPFLENVWNLAKSSDKLSLEIFDAGRHMYTISRTVDNVRNDMFRQSSRPTLHDELKVYSVDHLVLTWRLYNHISEYEMLKREQVDNYKGCKFALWANNAEEWLKETEAFQKACTIHETLHRHALDCFIAEEASDTDKALADFDLTLKDYYAFNAALDELHGVLRDKGFVDETQFVRYT